MASSVVHSHFCTRPYFTTHILPIITRACCRPAVTLGHSFGRWHYTSEHGKLGSLPYTWPQLYFLLSLCVHLRTKKRKVFHSWVFCFNISALRWSKRVEVMSFTRIKTKLQSSAWFSFFVFQNPWISVLIFLMLLPFTLDWQLFYLCIKGQCWNHSLLGISSYRG